MGTLRRRLRTILVVDDDPLLLSALERDLRARGLDVHRAAAAAEALEVARRVKPDCALVDLCIGQDSGIDLLHELKAEAPEMLVLLLTGQGAVQNAVDAFHGGAADFLQKPIGGKALEEAIERALARGHGAPAPTLAEAEFDHITRVLEECDGNISEAARRLGIHRRSLQRKLQKIPPHGSD
ncbi:MAG: two component transcriptional regulator, Fis family [Myxococcales bacterium]|nr:two component transcriptional regulator, Fis family [Myxococcales bacterium]